MSETPRERNEGCATKERSRTSSESPSLKYTRLDHLPLNLRGQESEVNLPGWLTHSFGSHGGDVALFRLYFPAEAAAGVSRAGTACDSRLLTARTCPCSCRSSQLCQSQAGCAAEGTLGICDCHSHTGSSRSASHSHLYLLTFCAAKHPLILISGVIIEFQKTSWCWLYS